MEIGLGTSGCRVEIRGIDLYRAVNFPGKESNRREELLYPYYFFPGK